MIFQFFKELAFHAICRFIYFDIFYSFGFENSCLVMVYYADISNSILTFYGDNCACYINIFEI